MKTQEEKEAYIRKYFTTPGYLNSVGIGEAGRLVMMVNGFLYQSDVEHLCSELGLGNMIVIAMKKDQLRVSFEHL